MHAHISSNKKRVAYVLIVTISSCIHYHCFFYIVCMCFHLCFQNMLFIQSSIYSRKPTIDGLGGCCVLYGVCCVLYGVCCVLYGVFHLHPFKKSLLQSTIIPPKPNTATKALIINILLFVVVSYLNTIR